MNKTIKALNKQLLKSKNDTVVIETKLQVAWNNVFDKSKDIVNLTTQVFDSQDFRFNEYGEVESYAYVDLSDFEDCKRYFENYMQELHFIKVDFKNECLTYNQGESLVIQDDTRHDNGVWLNGKCIIDETEYKNDGEVDETKRNQLIETYMEKEGYFPGVFRCDQYGNVFYVNTKEEKSA